MTTLPELNVHRPHFLNPQLVVPLLLLRRRPGSAWRRVERPRPTSARVSGGPPGRAPRCPELRFAEEARRARLPGRAPACLVQQQEALPAPAGRAVLLPRQVVRHLRLIQKRLVPQHAPAGRRPRKPVGKGVRFSGVAGAVEEARAGGGEGRRGGTGVRRGRRLRGRTGALAREAGDPAVHVAKLVQVAPPLAPNAQRLGATRKREWCERRRVKGSEGATKVKGVRRTAATQITNKATTPPPTVPTMRPILDSPPATSKGCTTPGGRGGGDGGGRGGGGVSGVGDVSCSCSGGGGGDGGGWSTDVTVIVTGCPKACPN